MKNKWQELKKEELFSVLLLNSNHLFNLHPRTTLSQDHPCPVPKAQFSVGQVFSSSNNRLSSFC